MRIVCDANMPYVKQAFATLGEVVLCDGREMTPELVATADLLIARSTTKVDRHLLAGRRLRFYGSGVIGTDHIDIPLLEELGIPWSSAPGCNAASVAQYLTVALVQLALRYGRQLDRMRLGVVGVGHVGRQVVARAQAIGMQVVCCDPPRKRDPADVAAQEFVPLEQLLQEADVVTLHTPLTRQGADATWHMLGAEQLALMRRDAWLINAARGGVVDGTAWLAARQRSHLQATVFDTWEPEPEFRPEIFAAVDWGTPHIAGHSYEGKVNGTMIVYRAACHTLGVAPTYEPELPEPPTPAIEVDAAGLSREALLRAVVLPTYSLEADDLVMRAIPAAATPARRGAAFDQLRRSYPMRREFSATRVTLRNATPAQEQMVRALGFIL